MRLLSICSLSIAIRIARSAISCTFLFFTIYCSIFFALVCSPAAAEPATGQRHSTQANRQATQDSDAPIELGEEYVEYARPVGSGNTARGSSGRSTGQDHSLTHKVLLYIPNRIVDLLDIFRLDLGAGPAVGGVVRVTKFAQAGMRNMLPLSVRVGLAGRRLPVFVESSNEIGVSPAFAQSKDRNVSAGELGLGIDLGIIGAYGGVCLDEAGDFLAGIVGFDPKDDDF